MDIISKVNQLKEKDESIYNNKIEELKKTIGKEKVETKMKELDEKYGDELKQYVKKIEKYNKNATNREKAELILNMKKKLSNEDQKKINKLLKIFKNYMKDI